MKSVGEVMAIGSTFKESFQKAIRGLEIGKSGLDGFEKKLNKSSLRAGIISPTPDRIYFIAEALRLDYSIDDLNTMSGIDPWFLKELKEIIDFEKNIAHEDFFNNKEEFYKAKQMGFSDQKISLIRNQDENEIRKIRKKLKINPVFKRVDTCAAEFKTTTAYMYSTYQEECESDPTDKKKVMVLGGGPNRIGQGIEFDYCCVHAAQALKENGFETIMVNCNPETCLLYTSPSPRDATLSRMPSSA